MAREGASPATRDILNPVLPSLFKLDENLHPRPELVADWPAPDEISFDPFTVALRLRQASWSDGRPIVADDVRFSFEELREGPTGHRYELLQEVEVTGPQTFRLVFDRPMRRWWSLFSLDDMVLPAHAYDPEEWDRGPTVSGGPYLVEGWTRGLEVRLRRNESYWGIPAILAGIDVQFVPDSETRFQLLERGELEAFFSEGDSNVGRRSQARGLEVVEGPLDEAGGASGAWGPSWWELELDSARLGEDLARAVVQALDPALVSELFEDSARPLDGIPPRFPPGEGFAEPWSGRGDLEAARSLIEGSPDFQLAFPRMGGAGAIARFAHFRLREIGVRAELAAIEAHAFVALGSAVPVRLQLRRGADAPDARLYGEGRNVELAETAVALDRLREGPVIGLAPQAWARVQDELVARSSRAPLVQVRSWLVGREGLAGAQATGTSEGPLWNVADWRIFND